MTVIPSLQFAKLICALDARDVKISDVTQICNASSWIWMYHRRNDFWCIIAGV